MALIKCGECGNSVSDKAASCPHCGNPIATNETAPLPLSVETRRGEAVTIERTGKGPKLAKLFGVLMLVLGIPIAAAGGETSGGIALVGFLLFLGGAILYIWGRFAAWWYHG